MPTFTADLHDVKRTLRKPGGKVSPSLDCTWVFVFTVADRKVKYLHLLLEQDSTLFSLTTNRNTKTKNSPAVNYKPHEFRSCPGTDVIAFSSVPFSPSVTSQKDFVSPRSRQEINIKKNSQFNNNVLSRKTPISSHHVHFFQ